MVSSIEMITAVLKESTHTRPGGIRICICTEGALASWIIPWARVSQRVSSSAATDDEDTTCNAPTLRIIAPEEVKVTRVSTWAAVSVTRGNLQPPAQHERPRLHLLLLLRERGLRGEVFSR